MSIQSVFEQFRQQTVLVVGDAMIDRYLFGRVDRISPEAPVPVLRWSSEEDRPGGAANVALNLRALGAHPELCTVVGRDVEGEQFSEMLPHAGLTNKGLLFGESRKTTVKTRMIAEGQHLLRVDREDRFPLNPAVEKQLLAQVEERLSTSPPQAIVLQDYNKGVLTPHIITTILQIAQKQSIPVVVDPKYNHFFEYQGCALFKPNLREINALLPEPVQPHLSALEKADQWLRTQLGHRYTMITLSENGIFISDGETAEIVPTRPRNISDVCGAGDTVVSVAALGVALGLPLKQVAVLSNLAGGQVCEKPGVVPVDLELLKMEAEGEGFALS